MKKGFTLVEVLAIIAVLGIILITVVPNIGGSIEKKKEEEYKKIINLIENAAKTYYSYNNDIMSVGVDELLKEDLITTDLINPITNEKITGCVNVTTDEDGIKQFIFSDKCNVLLLTHIENLYNTAATENGLVKDDTDDQNIRYAGSNDVVKNYVSFDGDVWRIIGIVDGKVKLVKEKSIGSYSWDSSTEDKNTGWGYNIWETIDGKTKSDGTTKADLNIFLNEGYYDGTYPSVCYGGKKNTEKLCPTEYVNSLLKSMIDENALWHLGGQTYSEPSTPPYGLSTLKSYYKERGTTIYSGITNIAKTEWNGAVGLIYPSDYGYASTDNECITNLRAGVSYENETWNYSNTKCKNNNWLHKNNNYWTISPNLNDSIYVFFVYSNGFVHSYSASNAYEVFPVVYLKSNIIIENGNGTSDDPYILKLL